MQNKGLQGRFYNMCVIQLVSRMTYLANIEGFISCELLQYEELVPYPAAFVPVQDLPRAWIRVRGLLQVPRARIHPPAAPLPQGKQQCQESQGSVYAWAATPHHLGLLPNTPRSKIDSTAERSKPSGFYPNSTDPVVSPESKSSQTQHMGWKRVKLCIFCCVALLVFMIEEWKWGNSLHFCAKELTLKLANRVSSKRAGFGTRAV